MTDGTGIYLHIPFCLSRCHYCDFCSRTRADDATKALYVKRLCEEITKTAQELGDSKKRADTVYFGGGTPTLLSPRQFGQIIEVVDASFGIEKNAEITAETNPKTASLEKLKEMHALGINRLSIGMQSVHDDELKALGRIHCFKDFYDIYLDARAAGFDNISADIMYGIPEQTRESFSHSIETLAVMHPEHISSYCLTVEEGTNFGKRCNSLALPDEDTVSDMYQTMTEMLEKYGYKKYEISNFAYNGQVSRHNLKYWKRDDYLGFGAAAHSFFGGIRYSNSKDVEGYLRGEDIRDSYDVINSKEALEEYVMLGMRLAEGINIPEFESLFNMGFMSSYGNTFKRFSPEYIYIDEKVCRFTDKGMFVSNYILSET